MHMVPPFAIKYIVRDSPKVNEMELFFWYYFALL